MDDGDKQNIIATLNIIKDEAALITRKCDALESFIRALKTAGSD